VERERSRAEIARGRAHPPRKRRRGSQRVSSEGNKMTHRTTDQFFITAVDKRLCGYSRARVRNRGFAKAHWMLLEQGLGSLIKGNRETVINYDFLRDILWKKTRVRISQRIPSSKEMCLMIPSKMTNVRIERRNATLSRRIFLSSRNFKNFSRSFVICTSSAFNWSCAVKSSFFKFPTVTDRSWEISSARFSSISSFSFSCNKAPNYIWDLLKWFR